MLKTVEDVTRRLIEYYAPDRIILYGSYGTPLSKKDSDVDLFIIKDTKKRPVERRIEVENLLSERSLPLDIMIYTSQEVRFLFEIGSPFIEEVMEKGRLLYIRATSGWIKDAEDELDSAVILCEHGKYRGSCYHSQQCVEKGLKALILEKGERPGRIHDIVELYSRVTQMGWDVGFPLDDAIFLNSIYSRH